MGKKTLHLFSLSSYAPNNYIMNGLYLRRIEYWLYWKYTGLYYSRSFGQKLMGLAVLAEDGSEMTNKMWEIQEASRFEHTTTAGQHIT
mgnify:CR=1 FL=1